MHRRIYRSAACLVLSLLSAIGLHLATAPSSQAHWADMSAAEILVDAATVRVNLTYPTGLTAFADDDQNGQISNSELQTHHSQLQRFLGEAVQLHNSENQAAQLSLQTHTDLQTLGVTAPNSHSTVQLLYSWPQPVQGLTIYYNLFLPGVSTASCLATILQNHQLQTFVFTPDRQVLALSASSHTGLLLALGGALVWGALHSLSPGHGKTLVGAYLVGSRATPRHALFLALTTTATHTVGIFSLGLVTLFASRYIVPAQLYPWMNLVSGLLVVGIGCNLLRSRLLNSQLAHGHPHSESPPSATRMESETQQSQPFVAAASGHPPDVGVGPILVQEHQMHSVHEHDHDSADHNHHHHRNHHHRDHDYHFHHHHSDNHKHHFNHSDHGHSHLPPESLTWRSLWLLGVSGGLIPCPAALVLLLSCMALGKIVLGLLLVVAFSLGLATVLTGLGLGLVYAKRAFDAPLAQRATQFLPKPLARLIDQLSFKLVSIVSAAGITVIGLGLVTQALLQVIKPF
jgi:nickel/cobalt transporter (NicO) family protein